ncbi:cysteinyl-tRNA synthetase [Syntrophus gentianae]|uniref:Cysteine--tRNA ligase n=1 Tax=Syntrophus gentianae TaxID=43775 RepID=A0A1H7URD4_9BACT|nr:cysteine--tRNA ligase [Syntrophus gentianae]SEL99384.1 cysteinyl-tRNA synthetase [Syntrophus gentianae]
MSLKLYNTLRNRKEVFTPLQEGRVGLYVCGITVYDICHVGHARSAVVFDVLRRYLEYRGYEVTYVKNFTDVDDKIIARANAEGVSIYDISNRYIAAHDEDMAGLGVLQPTVTPRATEHIEGMIKLIEQLMARGLAYAVDGNVYYAVERFSGYGKLSGRQLEDMMAGARIDVNEHKNNPMDFALWKASKPNEPSWESPWGPGRPGWHIECSVMSQKYLGDTFDIHGGGEDLVFPHHENEIAQSEGATGKPLANLWIHNGFVKINSEKMSKSLGNVFSIQEMLARYCAEAIRLFMLQSHYRSAVDFSEESLSEARQGMDRFYAMLKAISDLLTPSGGDATPLAPESLTGKTAELYALIQGLPDRFIEAMDDDLNTARAIGYLFDAARQINAFLSDSKAAKSDAGRKVLALAGKNIKEVGYVLGLFQENPDTYFLKDRERETRKRGIDPAEIEQLIAERWAARTAKNWQRADELRQLLSEKGIALKDAPTGTTWKVA